MRVTWGVGLACLGLLTGCARFFPSDPVALNLALVREGDDLVIRLPSCATGTALDIQVSDNTPSEDETPFVVFWLVHQPWPKGQTSFVIGRSVPGERLVTPLVPLKDHPYVEVSVHGNEKSGWSSAFDLRQVTSELNAGEDHSTPISQAELDRIGGCGSSDLGPTP